MAPLLLSVTASLALLLLGSAHAQDDCSCSFSVNPDMEEGCHVYGTAGGVNGSLFAWDRGNETCLDALNISKREVTFRQLFQICPMINGTEFIPGGFQKFIQDNEENPGEIAKAIMNAYPEFFNTTDNGTTYTLADQIQASTTKDWINCTETESFCWNEIHVVLSTSAGEAGFVCEKFYTWLKLQLQEEQGELRDYICDRLAEVVDALESDDIPPACEGLAMQVKTFREEHPDITCDDLKLSALLNATPPACEAMSTDDAGTGENPTVSNNGGDTSGGAASSAWFSGTAALSLAAFISLL